MYSLKLCHKFSNFEHCNPLQSIGLCKNFILSQSYNTFSISRQMYIVFQHKYIKADFLFYLKDANF